MHLNPSEAERLLPSRSRSAVVLMPSFGTCPTRLENQEYVTAWYAARGLPTVLGLDEASERSGWFSRSRAVNAAARRAVLEHPDRDVFVICDNDLTPDPAPFLTALTVAGLHSAVMPHSVTLLTTPIGRRELLMTGSTNRYEPVTQGSRSFVVITRDNFARVNGMDEVFEGWGPEDLAFRLSIQKQLSAPLELSGKRLHLWHPTDPSKRDMRQLTRNRKRKHEYQRASSERARVMAREYGRWDDGLRAPIERGHGAPQHA